MPEAINRFLCTFTPTWNVLWPEETPVWCLSQSVCFYCLKFSFVDFLCCSFWSLITWIYALTSPFFPSCISDPVSLSMGLCCYACIYDCLCKLSSFSFSVSSESRFWCCHCCLLAHGRHKTPLFSSFHEMSAISRDPRPSIRWGSGNAVQEEEGL